IGMRAGHEDLPELLRITLMESARDREVGVDPDVHAPAVDLALVGAPDDDKGLPVLSQHRIQELCAVGRAGLPVRPDERDRTRAVRGELERLGQQFPYAIRIDAKLDRQQISGVMPRRVGQQRGVAGSCPRPEEALLTGHRTSKNVWTQTLS